VTYYSIILSLLQRLHFFLLNSSLCLPSAFSVIFTHFFFLPFLLFLLLSDILFLLFLLSLLLLPSVFFLCFVILLRYLLLNLLHLPLLLSLLLLCLFLLNPHFLTCGNTRPCSATITKLFFLLWHCDPTRVMASSFLRFLDHTQRRTTVGRTPLDVWSARRRDLYLTTHNTHNRQISMPPVGFEPTIAAGELPQAYALGRAATGTISKL